MLLERRKVLHLFLEGKRPGCKMRNLLDVMLLVNHCHCLAVH